MREGTVTREDIIEFDKKQKEFELKKKNEMIFWLGVLQDVL